MHSTIKTIHFTINTIKYVYFNQKHVVVESSRNKNEYIFEIFEINFSNFYFFFHGQPQTSINCIIRILEQRTILMGFWSLEGNWNFDLKIP